MKGAVIIGIALLFGVASPARAQQSSVPVAARDLARGHVLRAEDIALVNAAEEGAEVEPGWVTRRVISEGEVLRAPAVAPPRMVRVGQVVEMVRRHGHVELRLRGQAMNNAALGERVHVRIDAQRRFEGEAIGPGRVRLNPGR